MIGHLRGTVKRKQDSFVLLDCNGVGYEIQIPKRTQMQIPELDDEVTLQTHLHVRPEAHSVYGFLTIAERDMFRVLINISGIGPSHALNILSELNLSELATCVRYNDPKPLEKVPRIGKSTAAKLLIELANKIDHIVLTESSGEQGDEVGADYLEEAVEALVVMGFSNREARNAIAQIRSTADTTEQAIRQALSHLGSTGT